LPPRQAPSFLASPPQDAGELANFPELVLPAGAEIHRIHAADLGAWYFNAEDTWRFNPCSIAGLGACYLAERPVAGLLESFKGVSVVDEQDIAAKAHFTVTLKTEIRLADCCVPAAGDFGVNGEIHNHAMTQAWAAALAQAGFAGVRYLCRSDPEMSLIGYAFFDKAGEASRGRWPAGQDTSISEDILEEAEAHGLRVRSTR
jgi:RES domain